MSYYTERENKKIFLRILFKHDDVPVDDMKRIASSTERLCTLLIQQAISQNGQHKGLEGKGTNAEDPNNR